MQQLPDSPVRFQFGVRGWAALAVGLAVLVVIALLTISFLFLILPLVLLAPVFLWFLPKPKPYKVGSSTENPQKTEASVIEGDFRVISSAQNQNPDSEVT